MAFKLFACCIPVKGAQRSLICDLQRRCYDFIPNALFDILNSYPTYDIEIIKKEFSIEQQKTVDEYFNFLISKEYLFDTDQPENFPDISMKWEMPNLITNSIIEYNPLLKHAYFRSFKELSVLGCKYLELRFDNASSSDIAEVLHQLHDSSIMGIYVHVNSPWNADIESEIVKENRIYTVIFYNCPERSMKRLNSGAIIVYSDKSYGGAKGCGVISPDFFSPNIGLFTESQKHNTCLNKKVCIDSVGTIKNCPSMREGYGSINDTSLYTIVELPAFIEKWFINKDAIKVCRDCEFRYICTDCRAYIENPNDIYSKPLKCGYDPYSCSWQDWSTNPIKKEAIDYFAL